jgi:ribonuclease E
MAKEMLINVSEGEECRIALLEDGKLEELYMERTSSTSHVGNIYKGKVTNVEPSIQAAFIDFGLPRNGFLHITDLLPQYFGRKGEDVHESVGRKMARRDRPPIQKCLRRGDEITVQIIKEGIGTKGPTLSTYLSIPGRILVMMPGMSQLGVSRKIEDEEERRRLRQILDSLKPPKECGFIIRTAGVGKTKADIERDLKYLTRLWENFKKERDSGPAPIELYREGDLVTRTVRDVFSGDIDRIVVDSKDVAKRVKDFIKLAMPRTKNKVEMHEELVPLFHKYGIEREIEQIYSRHVPLPSGGSLVIDSTEAIVAIDVNSGKFREHADAETTAFKTDMEAADEIPRQLKLRDLGGVIICDFIDLRFERHRRELDKRLQDNFRNDRARTKVLHMSQFGIIEITRQRMRPSLKRSIYFDCPHCKGAGLVKTPESMSLDVMRRLAIAAHDQRVQRLELGVCPDVAFYLQNRKRKQLADLEEESGRKILIRSELTLGLDEMRLNLFDARDGLVVIEELAPSTQQPPHATQLGARPGGSSGRGRHDHSHDRSRPPHREPEPEAMDERMEMEEAEDGSPEPSPKAQQREGREPHEGRESRDRREPRDEREPRGKVESHDQRQPRDQRGQRNQRNQRDQRRPAPPAAPPRDEPRPQAQPRQPERSASPENAQGEGGRRRRRGRRGRGGGGQGGQGSPGNDAARRDQRDHRDTTRPPGRQLSLAERLAGIMDYPDEMDDRSDAARPSDDTLPIPPSSAPREEQEEIEPTMAREPQPPEADEEVAEAKPRARRRRGGRRRGGKNADVSESADSDSSQPRSERSPEVADEPPPRILEDAIPVARVGSTEHAVDEDEPPVRRARTYRDLDEIPDDFD